MTDTIDLARNSVNLVTTFILAENGIEQPTVEQTKDFINIRLKGVALPVSPAFSEEEYSIKDKNGQVKPKFSGKNPSYLQGNGTPQTIAHSQYKDKLPLDSTYSKIYRIKEQQGIGILVNDNCLSLPLDFDRKHFESDDHLNQVITDFLEKYPKLKNTYIEKTRNGGYHIFIKVKNKPDFSLFTLEGRNFKCGELLKNNFCVMAPTSGYIIVNKPEKLEDIPEFNDVSEIGIVKFSDVKSLVIEKPVTVAEAKEAFSDLETQAISLESLISENNRNILKGICQETDDRSSLLATFAKDIYGCFNTIKNDFPQLVELIIGTPENLINTCGSALGIDSNRIERIVNTIDPINCLPSCYSHANGRETFARKIAKLTSPAKEKWLVSTTVEETILTDLLEDGEGDFKNIAGTFSKYTHEGYHEKYKEARLARDITEATRKCYSITQKGIISYKFATDAKVRSCISFSNSSLYVEKTENTKLRCFRNITYDFENKQRLEHSREHYLTSRINHDFIEGITEVPPAFKAFVEKSFGLEKIELIQAMFGMYIDPTTPYAYFFNLIGESGSGKGVMCNLIEKLYNRDAIASMQSFQDLSTPQRRYQSLSGKALLVFYDLEGFQDRSGWINSLVVNEPIDFTPLYSNASTSEERNIRMLISSVKPISVGNLESGLLRRVIPLTTKEKIKEAEKDLELTNKLHKEMSLIISWALSMDRNKRIDVLKNAESLESVREAKKEFRLANSSILHFADHALMPSETNWISLIKLYGAYKSHCDLFGMKPLKEAELGKKLKTEFPNLYRQSEVTVNPLTNKRDRSSLPARMYVEISEAYTNYDGIFSIDRESLIDGALDCLYESKKKTDSENLKIEQPITVESVENASIQSESQVVQIDDLTNLKCDLSQEHSDIQKTGEILHKAGQKLRERFYADIDANRKDTYEKARKSFEDSQQKITVIDSDSDIENLDF